MVHSDRLSRRLVGWIALLSAAVELIDAFFIEFPPAAIFLAVLFAGGWLWIRRGGIGGIVFVGVLFVLELVSVPSYPRDDASDWVIQVSFSALAIVGLSAAVAEIIAARRARDGGGSPSASSA